MEVSHAGLVCFVTDELIFFASDAESSKSDQACADPGAAGGKSENGSKDAKS